MRHKTLKGCITIPLTLEECHSLENIDPTAIVYVSKKPKKYVRNFWNCYCY